MEEKVREEVNTGMRSLRAVSPVVATALLVLIAVATAVLLYLWVSGTVSNTATTNPTLSERIKIDSVAVNVTTNTTTNTTNTTIYIFTRNVGDVTVNVTAAYVINATDGTLAGSNTTANTTLKPGDVKPIIVRLVNATLKDGVPYLVKVVTKDGVEATTTFVVKK